MIVHDGYPLETLKYLPYAHMMVIRRKRPERLYARMILALECNRQEHQFSRFPYPWIVAIDFIEQAIAPIACFAGQSARSGLFSDLVHSMRFKYSIVLALKATL